MSLFDVLFGTSTQKSKQGEFAERWDAGVKAFDKKDGATAAKIFRPFAEQGSADAQFRMAHLLLEGMGVPANNEEGFYWLNKAAMQKHEGALFMSGLAGMWNDPKNSYMIFYACSLISGVNGVGAKDLEKLLTSTSATLNQQEIAQAQAAARAFLRA
jgi:TPR repeat protein